MDLFGSFVMAVFAFLLHTGYVVIVIAENELERIVWCFGKTLIHLHDSDEEIKTTFMSIR